MPLPILIAAALVQGAAAAPARLTPEQADARCVVMLGFISTQGRMPADKMEAVKNGTAYYLGKLRGRNPNVNLPAVLDAAAKTAAAQKVPVGPESQRCGAELSSLAAASRPPAAATPRKP
ncbi:hypothetical protein [Sphingomonas mollis]|uniref:Rap1a immunity protein domain-containing protein n=1 Tax=Sphingomonas mollis TaxID=2795726 RepID=A0ABS0XRB2_9SPHN|nr:hypothetical protein [Sphingomonas sp. BT553]MBJ6122579.1 hypothetical protein [Sphingomonas sp. BT553]